MPARDPHIASIIGAIGASALHAQGKTNTEPARKGFRSKFEREVDPAGVLAPDERARRAEHARREHFLRLALKSAQVRRAKKAATQ